MAGEQKSLHELKAELEVVKAELAEVREWAQLAAPIVAAVRDMVAIFGNYHGTDNRIVPAVATAAWQTRGVVDILVFDNGHSGGVRELTDKELGTAKDEFMPYYWPEPESAEVANEPAAVMAS